jgi:hippurate hydrolase
MPVIEAISARQAAMTALRRDLHAHPELGFCERRTAGIVAETLRGCGLAVTEGVGGTGVVGTLTTGDGPSIALRADMDALPIQEVNTFEHRSCTPNVMHACGHDGHTVMLLEAARYLAETRKFRGTVRFVFQPAEELLSGARAMLDDGLIERFPFDAIYGMHDWSEGRFGTLATIRGILLASADTFTITVIGRGCHGAFPHDGIDAVLVACEIARGLQTFSSRNVDPIDSAVISVCQIHGGEAFNVMPEKVRLAGTARALAPEVRDRIEPAIRRIAEGIAATYGARAEVEYARLSPAVINDTDAVDRAAAAAVDVVGPENVILEPRIKMAAEDFAYFLAERPGCYLWIGSRRDDGHGTLHNAAFDFNDPLLPVGAGIWARLVERILT